MDVSTLATNLGTHFLAATAKPNAIGQFVVDSVEGGLNALFSHGAINTASWMQKNVQHVHAQQISAIISPSPFTNRAVDLPHCERELARREVAGKLVRSHVVEALVG
jgi:hypothetical protein